MGTMSGTAARALVAGLGAITLAIGARVAYTSYLSQKVLGQCIAGGSCSLNLSGIDLLSAYSSARGQALSRRRVGGLWNNRYGVLVSLRRKLHEDHSG